MVFLCGYLLTKLQGSPRFSRTTKTLITASVICLYSLAKLGLVLSDLPVSLYQTTGLTRNTRCEEVRSLYRVIAKAKHPDRNLGEDTSDDFIAFQQSFETLGNPTQRIRYELYGRTEDDAMAKDLGSHIGFYMQTLLLAYSLTCNRVRTTQNTVRAGMNALVSLVMFASAEWTLKSLPPSTPPYGYLPFTIHTQFELLRSLFFPLLLFLYIESGSYYTSVLENKKAKWTA